MSTKSGLRICQAAKYADRLVEEVFFYEDANAATTVSTSIGHPLRAGEESITDFLLPRISYHFADVVETATFCKQSMEPRTGADWLWVFRFGPQSLYLLVQAKRMYRPKRPAEPWRIKIDVHQKERLENTAQEMRLNPVYCLYAPIKDASGSQSHIQLVPSQNLVIPPKQKYQKTFRMGEISKLKCLIPFADLCCGDWKLERVRSLLPGQATQQLDERSLEEVVKSIREHTNIQGVVAIGSPQTISDADNP